MFLDPEPKGQKHSSSSSPFFSSQAPMNSPKERMLKRNSALQERSPWQNNQLKAITREPDHQPTVRFVRHSPSPSSARLSSDSEESLYDAKKIGMQSHAALRLSPSSKQKLASAPKPGFSASRQADVSEPDKPTNEVDLPTSLPTTSMHAVPKTAWHRRSTSSGNYSSNAPTLNNADTVTTSDTGTATNERARSERYSQRTTLRDTPTPYEQELLQHQERWKAESSLAPGNVAQALQTLQEASPERPTVRPVPPSIASSSSDHCLLSESASESDTAPREADGIPRRTSSTGSSPAPLTARKIRPRSAPRQQESHESFARSALTTPQQLAYSPHSARPRSSSHPLYHTASTESIQSPLQYPSIARPQTGRSLATSSPWAYSQLSSSTDTLPPLQIPKKRLHHKQGSKSLNSLAGPFSTGNISMSQEEIDTLPYPRQAFSSHLSTIASESDRAASQQLSHFSLGSGVLSGDDASSIPLSGTWGRQRRGSAPLSMISVSESSPIPGSVISSHEEPGDMTLGIFRAESAKPEPLFKPRSGNVPADDSRRYSGPLPPFPPIPRSLDHDEGFDTVCELAPPPLRQKRSGYSLRQRSNSTPSHSRGISQISYDGSERWSPTSSIFPTWAKHFYAGTAGLVSASKISLSLHTTPRREEMPAHKREDSQWTERSITSRLGSGHNNISTPTSSHFLPSIFRPRTRPLANVEGASRSSKLRRSKKSRPSGEDDGRLDSLAIFTDPLPQAGDRDILPSGQPKWGVLKNGQPPHPPLPRKYSKQKHWDEMQFPRPMTKDRLSDFQLFPPHLAHSKRASRRLSAWRTPSFVESLDTLFKSRGNRQILLFALGFVCPLLWMLAAVLPLPNQPISASELEETLAGSEEDVAAAMMKHEAGDAERRWREERRWLKARWWRTLNRIMSVVGVLVVAAVIALAVVATRTNTWT